MIIAWISIRRNRAGKLESETLRKNQTDILTAIDEIIRAMEVLKYDKLERQDSTLLLMKSDLKKEGCHLIIGIGGLPDEIDAMLTDPRIRKYLPKAP